MTLLLVFLAAFGAATILPFASEVMIVAAYEQGENVFLVWVFGTLGNTLGSGVTYALGRFLMRYKNRRWFFVKAEDIKRGTAWFSKYGVWSLLLSWVPIIGDALTFVAGVSKVRFSLFLFLVCIGKGVRYAIFIAAISQLW